MFTSMDITIMTMITRSINIIMTTIMRNMSTIITTMTMKNVAADMTMTTITRNMSTIITTMTMKSVAADMIMTTITTMKNAAADMTIITIIMQTKFSQAGAVRQLRNTQEKILKRSLRHCLRQKNMESSFVRKECFRQKTEHGSTLIWFRKKQRSAAGHRNIQDVSA